MYGTNTIQIPHIYKCIKDCKIKDIPIKRGELFEIHYLSGTFTKFENIEDASVSFIIVINSESTKLIQNNFKSIPYNIYENLIENFPAKEVVNILKGEEY